GLGDLADGEPVVLDLDDRLARIDDLELDDRIDADGDVVAGDALLSRHRHGHDPAVDLLVSVDEENDRLPPRLLGIGMHPAEAEDHSPLVLFDDPQAVSQRDGSENDKRGKNCECDHVESPPLTTDGLSMLALDWSAGPESVIIPADSQ